MRVPTVGIGAGVLGDRAGREGDVGRRLVDVGDRDREGLLEEQAAGIGGADADVVGAVGLEVERGVGAQAVAEDVEGGVVGRPGAGDQGVGERVTRIRIGGRQGADLGIGAGVLGDGLVVEGDVGRRGIRCGHYESWVRRSVDHSCNCTAAARLAVGGCTRNAVCSGATRRCGTELHGDELIRRSEAGAIVQAQRIVDELSRPSGVISAARDHGGSRDRRQAGRQDNKRRLDVHRRRSSG